MLPVGLNAVANSYLDSVEVKGSNCTFENHTQKSVVQFNHYFAVLQFNYHQLFQNLETKHVQFHYRNLKLSNKSESANGVHIGIVSNE